MTDVDNRLSALDGSDLLEELGFALWIEVGSRLIEDAELRLFRKGSAEDDLLH